MKLTIRKTVEVTPCTYKQMCRAISHGNWDPGWDPVVMRRMKMSKAKLYAQLLADAEGEAHFNKMMKKTLKNASNTWDVENPEYFRYTWMWALPKKHWFVLWADAYQIAEEDYWEECDRKNFPEDFLEDEETA
jgi:hypothetical protein